MLTGYNITLKKQKLLYLFWFYITNPLKNISFYVL